MQNMMRDQTMGYDRAITMFSPDGRLLQVEYAKKTVKQGSTAIGIICKDAVIFVTDKRIVDKLIIGDSVEKIFQIDDHMMLTASGIISDARVLVDRAQLKAQQHKAKFDSPIDTISIVKDICSLKQVCTQSSGLRPFGVSLLIGAVDNGGIRLYETDPTGIYFQYKAVAIGEGEKEIKEILTEKFKDNMSVEDGIKLGLNSLKKFLDENFDINRIDVSVISSEDKQFKLLSKEEIKKYIN